MTFVPRILGAATAAYGLAALARPQILARQVGMLESGGGVSPAMRVVGGPIGVRDIATPVAGGWSALCALSYLAAR